MEKKTMMCCLGALILSGVGAWCLYSKLNPECARKVRKDMDKALKNLENIGSDM